MKKREPWKGMMDFAEQVLGDRLTDEHRRTMLDAASSAVKQAEAEAARKGITLAADDIDGIADLGMAIGFKQVKKDLAAARGTEPKE